MKTVTYDDEKFVLVPRKPTKKMREAAFFAFNYGVGGKEIYKAMIEAAPKAEKKTPARQRRSRIIVGN